MKDYHLVQRKMVESSSIVGKEVLNVQLINNDTCEPPKFCLILEVAYKEDPTKALSSIPTNVFMINDIYRCYMCKVREIGDFELRQSYDKLCGNGVLKDEYNIMKNKGLNSALDMPNVFKTEWIKVVLS